MIFITVGTQLPFDRLVRAIDEWAGATAAPDVFAQIGQGSYQPKNMPWARHLPGDEFREKVRNCSLVVSHAGIGNLLLALQFHKPMLVMPRRTEFNEHRNDHQLATAKWLRGLPGITVVDDAAELGEALGSGGWRTPNAVRSEASPELLAAVRNFIEAG